MLVLPVVVVVVVAVVVVVVVVLYYSRISSRIRSMISSLFLDAISHTQLRTLTTCFGYPNPVN